MTCLLMPLVTKGGVVATTLHFEEPVVCGNRIIKGIEAIQIFSVSWKATLR